MTKDSQNKHTHLDWHQTQKDILLDIKAEIKPNGCGIEQCSWEQPGQYVG